MSVIKAILTNGYILLIPILVWNLVFVSKLPPAFDPKSFNDKVPLVLLMGENIFRSIIFIFPVLVKINISTITGKQGLAVYIFGSIFYFLSWLLLIYAPNSLWSKSLIGFMAPAYIPVIWLIGISLMADSYYFKISYNMWHFLIPCIIFSILHITHSLFIYLRLN